MSAVLDYQLCHPKTRAEAMLSPRVLLPVVLTFAHIHLCWQISRSMLLSLCNGNMTAPIQWCSAVWIPGATAMNRFGPAAGIPLLIAGSALAGWMLCDLIFRKAANAPRLWGPFAWRLWTLLALWCAWIPVPGACSFIWQFRQWAIYG